jgi:hypothetical protein
VDHPVYYRRGPTARLPLAGPCNHHNIANPMPNTAQSSKLTKNYFMALPAGLYLISNCMKSIGEPIFADFVQPRPSRQSQWQAIVAARANGRVCHVFSSKAAFRKWISNLTPRFRHFGS